MPEELESTIYTNSGYNKHLDSISDIISWTCPNKFKGLPGGVRKKICDTNPADGGKRGK